MTTGERLRAADWRVDNIPEHGEAARLVREWHYSSSCPNTSTYRHGLYAAGLLTQCDGVAIWIPPTRAAGLAVNPTCPNGVLSLSRLVVAPWVPANGASFLLGRSMRLIDRQRWPTLLTFADTAQGHTGAIYLATNWRSDGEVPAGDVWELPDGSLCGRKRGGVTLTVEPKIRFVHDL